MNVHTIQQFLEDFFYHNECTIVDRTNTSITVELNKETDIDLGYRPFYWMYVENSNQKPNLLIKRYLFDPASPKEHSTDEHIYFGSNQLNQFFRAVHKNGRFVRLYEDYLSNKKTALTPWILINYKIEYISDKKREKIISLGLNLINGIIVEEFYAFALKKKLTPKLPAYLFTKSALYTASTAIEMLQNHIATILNGEDNGWASQAREKLDSETNNLLLYYKELQSKASEEHLEKLELEKEKRLAEIDLQYRPRISVNMINLAIVYLHSTINANDR